MDDTGALALGALLRSNSTLEYLHAWGTLSLCPWSHSGYFFVYVRLCSQETGSLVPAAVRSYPHSLWTEASRLSSCGVCTSCPLQWYQHIYSRNPSLDTEFHALLNPTPGLPVCLQTTRLMTPVALVSLRVSVTTIVSVSCAWMVRVHLSCLFLLTVRLYPFLVG